MSKQSRIPTIKKRKEFLKIGNLGASAKTKTVIALCLKTEGKAVGFTASKKVGSAVMRNKAKRRLRALVREFSELFVDGFSFVFIANFKTPSIDFTSLRSDFVFALKKSKDRANDL